MFNKDIFQSLVSKYANLDIDYKRAVFFAFIVSIIAYSFQLTHVIMSPDMYVDIWPKGDYPINVSGRWFQAFLRNVILSTHRIVPTFNLLLSLLLFVGSSLLIAKMWRIKRPLYIFFIITVITTNTYTNHILRWENAHLEASITVFIAVLALFLAGRGLKMFFPGLFLMACAHGGYQTGISLACAVLFAGPALLLFQDGDFSNLKAYVKYKFIPGIAAISGGFLLHMLILKGFMFYLQLEPRSRMAAFHFPYSFDELARNVKLAFKAVPSLFTHQVIYFNFSITLFFKIIFLLLLAALLLFYLKKKCMQRVFLIIIVSVFLLATLMSTYLPTLVIGYPLTFNRMNYPVGVFYALVALIILSGSSIYLRNTAIIILLGILFLFAWHNNMYAYRAFIQDRADFDLASRIMSRIENLPEYEENLGKRLKFRVIGTRDIAAPGYRFSSWHGAKVVRRGAFMRTQSAHGIWNYLHFPQPTAYESDSASHGISKQGALTIMQMKEWPSCKSVAIIDGLAVVMFNKYDIGQNVLCTFFTNTDKKPVYVIKPDNMAFTSMRQISPVRPGGYFQAMGTDPSIYLNIPIPKKGHAYILFIHIDVPAKTQVYIFHNKPSAVKGISQRCNVNKGENKCFFYIKEEDFNGQLRLDPGGVIGIYRIREIAIHDIVLEP